MKCSVVPYHFAVAVLVVATATSSCTFDSQVGPTPPVPDTAQGPADTSAPTDVDTSAASPDGEVTEDTTPDRDTRDRDTGSPPDPDTRSGDTSADADTGADAAVECRDETCPDEHPNSKVTCFDNVDNDGDGRVDCGDPECDGERCSQDGGANCRMGQCAETRCWDNTDNDGDGLTDCGDSGACGSGRQCGTDDGRGATCQGGMCIETSCGDGVDNDGDGSTDCTDTECHNEPCGTNPPEECCTNPGGNWVCTDPTSTHCSR